MEDLDKFLYHFTGVLDDEVVTFAYQKFYVITRKFPRTIGVPAEDAGFQSQIMEVKIDRTICPGTIWMSR
jgi:hypothetical protein